MKIHNKYLQKLKDKGILVYPLEECINRKNKIKHKCTCGNEWLVTPVSVLCGNKCGCKYTKRESDYIKELGVKNLGVSLLGKYTRVDKKCLHRCTCGNEYEITPQSALRGMKCGCKNDETRRKLHKTTEEYNEEIAYKNIKAVEGYSGTENKIKHLCHCGNIWKATPASILQSTNSCGCGNIATHFNRYKNKKTILYYVKVNNLYKIGITLYKESVKKSIKNRFGTDINKGVNIKVIRTKVFDDGIRAYLLEQDILNKNKEYQYIGEKILGGGNTELFIKNIMNF